MISYGNYDFQLMCQNFLWVDHKIETLTENNTKLMEDHSQMVSDLTSTRSQLEASQRACKKLKRRTAKELADLERVAEEQCNRASAFSEELALLRRNYTYLQARVNVLIYIINYLLLKFYQ